MTGPRRCDFQRKGQRGKCGPSKTSSTQRGHSGLRMPYRGRPVRVRPKNGFTPGFASKMTEFTDRYCDRRFFTMHGARTGNSCGFLPVSNSGIWAFYRAAQVLATSIQILGLKSRTTDQISRVSCVLAMLLRPESSGPAASRRISDPCPRAERDLRDSELDAPRVNGTLGEPALIPACSSGFIPCGGSN